MAIMASSLPPRHDEAPDETVSAFAGTIPDHELLAHAEKHADAGAEEYDVKCRRRLDDDSNVVVRVDALAEDRSSIGQRERNGMHAGWILQTGGNRHVELCKRQKNGHVPSLSALATRTGSN